MLVPCLLEQGKILSFLNIPKLAPSWLSIFSAAAAEKHPWTDEIAICWEKIKRCKKILFPFCLWFQHNFKIGRFLENIPFWKQGIHFLKKKKGGAHRIYDLNALLQFLNHMSLRKETNWWFRHFMPSSLKASFKPLKSGALTFEKPANNLLHLLTNPNVTF